MNKNKATPNASAHPIADDFYSQVSNSVGLVIINRKSGSRKVGGREEKYLIVLNLPDFRTF